MYCIILSISGECFVFANLCWKILLDAISEDGESNQYTNGAIQIPNLRVVLKHFSADEDGETHNSAHK